MGKFPFYPQMDSMDCGPACLQMILKHHGRYYPLPWLRSISFLSREGVSLKGISIASVEGRSCCGKVSMNSFIVNFKMFTESQEYNSCLNRKISIDEEGFIRNCPSMTEHFGHISNASISELLGRYDIEKKLEN